ncbi:MAG: type II toxin-antitoxin system VapC family toxin [Candidatus Micrarchaeota archaeon]
MTALIDSSAWLDHFMAEKRGLEVRELLKSDEKVVTSSINLFEVYFQSLRKFPKEAEEIRGYILSRCDVIPADKEIVRDAAKVKLARGLSMADSIVWATAEKHGATIYTSDADFRGYRPLRLLR